MGVFKNDVGRPTNETIKKRRILKAILALLVAGTLFTGGYYVNEFINKYDANKEKENESKKEADELISTFNVVSNNFEKFGYFYKEDRKVDNLDNDIILISAISKLITEDKYIFTKNEVNESVKKIFGNIKYNDESVSSYCYEFNYDASKELYTDNSGCSGDGPSIYSEIINVETSSNKLTIIDKIAVSDFNYDSGILTLYKDLNRSIVIKENYDLDEGIKEYLDILDSYKWTFVKNSEGNYIFESVDKISKEVAENKDSKELDINSEEVMDLYIPFSYFMHEASGEELYKKDKVTQADLSVEYKNRLAFAKLYNSVSYDNLFTDKIEISKEDGLYVSGFKSEVLEKYYKKLFGKNAKYVAKTFDSYSINTLYMYYDEKTDTYSEDLAGGDWTSFRYGNEIYKAIEADNKIELYLYVVVFNSDSENKGGVYRDIEDATNFKNAIKEVKTYDEFVYLMKYKDKKISYEGIYFDDLSDYKDEASQYKITFVKEDNNYIFESVEKIK